MAQKFRTKIVEIEAQRFTGDNWDDMFSWAESNFLKWEGVSHHGVPSAFPGIVYDKLHGTWIGVLPGQWIVRGAKGEYYPCDDETFHWKYEEVDGQQG